MVNFTSNLNKKRKRKVNMKTKQVYDNLAFSAGFPL
jgi:hypothetical protein